VSQIRLSPLQSPFAKHSTHPPDDAKHRGGRTPPQTASDVHPTQRPEARSHAGRSGEHSPSVVQRGAPADVMRSLLTSPHAASAIIERRVTQSVAEAIAFDRFSPRE
jgi:hypothetical protein